MLRRSPLGLLHPQQYLRVAQRPEHHPAQLLVQVKPQLCLQQGRVQVPAAVLIVATQPLGARQQRERIERRPPRREVRPVIIRYHCVPVQRAV